MNWNGKMKAVTFSYDDGIIFDRKLVEIFNKYGLKCTFNLNTGIQNEESRWVDSGTVIYRMNQADIGKLYDGHEIAAHALTHQSLTGLNEEEFAKEMETDIANIERIYGVKPVGMAYPYGTYNDTVVEGLAKLGLKYARTVEATHGFDLQTDLLRFKATCHHGDDMLFDLAEQFLSAKPDKPMLFYVWGHSYEFERDGNWDRIEKLCSMISGHDDIFYGTNRETLL